MLRPLIALAIAGATLAATPALAQTSQKKDARIECKEQTARQLRVPFDSITTDAKPTPYANDPTLFRFNWRADNGAEGVCRVRDGVVRNWEVTRAAVVRVRPNELCREKVGATLKVNPNNVEVARTSQGGGLTTFTWIFKNKTGTCRVNEASGDVVLVVR